MSSFDFREFLNGAMKGETISSVPEKEVVLSAVKDVFVFDEENWNTSDEAVDAFLEKLLTEEKDLDLLDVKKFDEEMKKLGEDSLADVPFSEDFFDLELPLSSSDAE